MENDERDKIARRREIVKISYDLAWKENNDLYKNGILTKDEFEKAKKKILN